MCVAGPCCSQRYYPQSAAGKFHTSANRLYPTSNNYFACARRRILHGTLRHGHPRIHEIDLAIRDGRPKRFYPRTGYLAVTQVKAHQFFQGSELRQSRISEAAAVKVQLSQMRHTYERVCRCVCDSRTQEVQLSHRGQILQMDQSGIRDLHATEVQLLQLSEAAQVFEALVSHQRVAQIQPFQRLQLGQSFHSFVVEWGETKIE